VQRIKGVTEFGPEAQASGEAAGGTCKVFMGVYRAYDDKAKITLFYHDLDGILGKMSLLKEWQALGQAAQGSRGVTVPGGVPKPCGCGTWGHGLAGMGVLGLMILEVFSNLND